jgi:hypothetical protein
MPSKKKRRRESERPTIHPRNKYSETRPDFALLASLYPSFNAFVFYSHDAGRPRIDWTDFNATRELTRVLLLHDHNLHWYFTLLTTPFYFLCFWVLKFIGKFLFFFERIGFVFLGLFLLWSCFYVSIYY